MAPEYDLMPGEAAIDQIKVGSGDLVLTDRRIIFLGDTAGLGAEYALVRGSARASAPLVGYASAVIGTGKRPWALLSSLALAVASAVMFAVPPARYVGLVAVCLSLLLFLVWLSWSRTFLAINAGGLCISGAAGRREALVFAERLEHAAVAARLGLGPEAVRAAALESGKPSAKSK